MSHATAEELNRAAATELEKVLPRVASLSAKDRLKIPAQDMPSQDPAVRRRNINEVALGYSPAQARLEALRCLQCRNAACVAGCPAYALHFGDLDDANSPVSRLLKKPHFQLLEEAGTKPRVYYLGAYLPGSDIRQIEAVKARV